MLNAGITKSAGKNDSNRNISIYVSMAKTNNAKEQTRQPSISASTSKSNTYILKNRRSTRGYINMPYNVPTFGETSGT